MSAVNFEMCVLVSPYRINNNFFLALIFFQVNNIGFRKTFGNYLKRKLLCRNKPRTAIKN